MQLANKKLFLFDLDGTLYEGTDHFDFYAKKLAEHVEEAKREQFFKEYAKMKQGDHVVAIGKGYDIAKDCLISIDPMTLRAVAVEEWNGERWPAEKIVEIYPNPITFDFESIIAIGDGWWLPFVNAKHFGVIDCYGSYLATKEYMVTDEFQLDQIDGLREWLLTLKAARKSLVLITNSDAEDVGRLLTELQLTDIFERVIPSAQKPTRTKEIFEKLLQEYDVTPNSTVSLGDNFINEIGPALLLGLNGVYIHPNQVEVEHENLYVIPTIRDCYDK